MTDVSPRPHLSAARRAGNLLLLSGQLSLGEHASVVGDTIEQQTRQCLANLDTVLAAHGLGREHVVKTTVWLKNAGDFADFNVPYAEFFGEHRPARSTVCAELVLPSALIEIEATASFD